MGEDESGQPRGAGRAGRKVRFWHALTLICSVGIGSYGCSGEAADEEPSDDAAAVLGYCDVTEILDAKCRRCHGDPPTHGAPFSLEGFDVMAEEFPSGSGKPLSDRMAWMIERDLMPYRDGQALEPPVEDLTPDEEAMLLEWLDAGAPRGSGSCD